MKRTVFTFSVVICLAVLSSRAPASDDPTPLLHGLVQQYFAYVRQSDFDSAASLFHYDRERTPKERSGGAQAVARMLQILTQEFGELSDQQIVNNPYITYEVTVGGAGSGYWEQHPVFLQRRYQVTFTREGSGYVKIMVCHISGVWEIRSVSYGLPAQRSDAEERIADILITIMKEMEPFRKDAEPAKDQSV